MLRNFVIFSLFLVASHADGEFAVLLSPNAISFSGKSPIESQYVGDILNAAMGNSADINVQWDGLTITDPFSLADSVVAVIVCGVEYIEPPNMIQKYKIEGDSVHVSLFAMSVSLEMDDIPMCNLDLVYTEFAVKKFKSCFGDNVHPIIPESEILKSDQPVDSDFLHSIGYINAAAENFDIMRQKSNVLFIHLSLDRLKDVHGEDSEVIGEATKMVEESIEKLRAAVQKSAGNDILVVALSQKEEEGSQQEEESSRRKRDVAEGSNKELNLAANYNQDYPVIFNIILWFMVTFGFSLLAICYAITDMDPGRDSVIYRMTSTKMKKDI